MPSPSSTPNQSQSVGEPPLMMRTSKINASHPEKRLERVHGKEIADCQIEQRAERTRAGERDRPRASAELARDHACERNDRRARQRREQANRKKRIAQEQLAQSKKQDRQRRLIDVTESQMSPAGDVIKFVAKITVPPVCQQMNQQALPALNTAINADSLNCVRLGGEFVARINYLTLALSF